MNDRRGNELTVGDNVWFRKDGGWYIGLVHLLRASPAYVECVDYWRRTPRFVVSAEIEKIPPEPPELPFEEVERRKFEAFVRAAYPHRSGLLVRDAAGDYQKAFVKDRWHGWLACARQAREEASVQG